MIDDSVEKWQQADDEVRKNLPPGVKLVRTLRGHTGFIGKITWSPNGRILASPSNDKSIRLWDTSTGECLSVLEGHKKMVSSVAFCAGGSILVSASVDQTIKLWDVINAN